MQSQIATPPRILAICSGGGHLCQLAEILPLEGFSQVDLLSPGGLQIEAVSKASKIVDCNINTPFRAMKCALQIARQIRGYDLIISTGALPGCIGIVIGKIFGLRTVWIDSIANAQKISLSGRVARPFCDLFYCQWPALAAKHNLRFRGAVL